MPPDSIEVVSGALTLDRALALAGRYDLRLRATGLRTDASRARIADANRRPNPILSVSEENFGGTLGGSHREATLAIGQVFERGGDRSARKANAEAEASVAGAEAGLLRRELGVVTAERFITAWSMQARLAHLQEGEHLTAQAIIAARDRHRAGATPELEVLRARSRATAQAVERQRAASELGIARQELALSWGATEATFDSLVAPEQTRTEDRVPPQIHPELTRASAAEAVASARIRAAQAARSPDLTLSAGVRRLEEAGGTGFLVGVELPLPLWSRGDGNLAAARMELVAATMERQALEQRIELALVAATERVRAASELLDTLRLRVRPAREHVVAELLRGYRAGRSSYLDLIAEQSNLIETDLQLVEAQADVWRAQVRVDQLTGTGPLAPRSER